MPAVEQLFCPTVAIAHLFCTELLLFVVHTILLSVCIFVLLSGSFYKYRLTNPVLAELLLYQTKVAQLFQPNSVQCLLQYKLIFLEDWWSFRWVLAISQVLYVCYCHLPRAGAFPHTELSCLLLMGGEYCQEIQLAPSKMPIGFYRWLVWA